MNRKIEEMIKEVERRGGTVGFMPDAPEELVEQFLTEVLDCPDCRAEAAARPDSKRTDH